MHYTNDMQLRLVIQRTIRHLVNLVMRDACTYGLFAVAGLIPRLAALSVVSASFRVVQFELDNRRNDERTRIHTTITSLSSRLLSVRSSCR